MYDSGSWDNSKGALTELDLLLENYGVERNINLSNTTHLDEMAVLDSAAGWVITLEGKREIRRIPYLFRIRNLSLEPLLNLSRQGQTFDKIPFLGDVAFTVRPR